MSQTVSPWMSSARNEQIQKQKWNQNKYVLWVCVCYGRSCVRVCMSVAHIRFLQFFFYFVFGFGWICKICRHKPNLRPIAQIINYVHDHDDDDDRIIQSNTSCVRLFIYETIWDMAGACKYIYAIAAECVRWIGVGADRSTSCVYVLARKKMADSFSAIFFPQRSFRLLYML